MVNLDMVGRLRNDFLTVGAASSAAWGPELIGDANLDGLTLNLDDRYLGGSDHYCFIVAGRPAVHFFTGLHAEYHTPLDDPPLLNQEGMLDIAELTVRVVRDLATRSSLPVGQH
jgi:Zn-dependent M28 family amino/carboxypeptidase